MPKVTRKSAKKAAKKNVPWTEIVSVSPVNSVASHVYARTAGYGHSQPSFDLSAVNSNGSHFDKKQAVIEKIKGNFRDSLNKVNKVLLHKYICPNCKQSLQVCYKSVPFTNVILDCNDIIHSKIAMK